ncbi:carboxylesterase family protein [Streptomyces sp. A 4/2]|uniref:carboxylesterase family protein n=1 Tax=Streptomyces sp. A 4/2 TaxID=2934314 RepID=UPI0020253B8A|nr:carboxylesterase family protein [Streptomyces sp. A 4/2]
MSTDLCVPTGSGTVRGFCDDRGVIHWRGVPFGFVPQRFRPAEPLAVAGDLDATHWGPVSWQAPPYLEKKLTTLLPGVVEAEQCLNLNVWSRSYGDGRPRPVLVWIHPGRNTCGAGAQPRIDHWTVAAQHEVVVVSGNYRLGPWGWLHLGLLDDRFTGTTNLGVRDQVLLLRWVRENIGAFGGDPDNVTLFGNSAGSSNVSTLFGVPEARGLFHRAAVYSGNAEQPTTAAEAVEFAEDFLRSAPSLAGGPAGLAGLSNVELRYMHRQLLRKGQVHYRPVIDGELIPKAPLDSVREGLIADVPLLVSVTSNEARWHDLVSDTEIDRLYAALPATDPSLTHDEKIDVVSRHVFIDPARRLLDAAAVTGTCWAQVFDYHATTSLTAADPRIKGRAMHTCDIESLFCDLASGTDTDRAVAAVEQGALVALATDGRPGWGPYDSEKPVARWVGPAPRTGALPTP